MHFPFSNHSREEMTSIQIQNQPRKDRLNARCFPFHSIKCGPFPSGSVPTLSRGSLSFPSVVPPEKIEVPNAALEANIITYGRQKWCNVFLHHTFRTWGTKGQTITNNPRRRTIHISRVIRLCFGLPCSNSHNSGLLVVRALRLLLGQGARR